MILGSCSERAVVERASQWWGQCNSLGSMKAIARRSAAEIRTSAIGVVIKNGFYRTHLSKPVA